MENCNELNKKYCKCCDSTKNITEFYIQRRCKDGLSCYCKICDKKIKKESKLKHKDTGIEYNKKYRQDNKERILKYNQEYRKKNLDRLRKREAAYHKKYYEKNQDKLRRYSIEFYWKDIDKSRGRLKISNSKRKHKRNEERNERRRVDVNFCLSEKMSNSIKKSLKRNKNGNHWEKLVNYILDELKSNIESKFTERMTWNDVLNGKIHIDHLLPKTLFEYISYEDVQFKICWSLDNLQPLWKKDNENKKDYLDSGKRACLMSSEEKLEYLRSKGFNV